MHQLLADIVATKKKEIRHLPKLFFVSKTRKRDFVTSVTDSGIIAEIKPKSPSAGKIIRSRKDVTKFVNYYNQAAQAISVLCDTTYFGGGYDLLEHVRGISDKPILAKEFIIHTKQIQHAKKHGADAVLLIATILETDEIIRLASYAIKYGLDVLLEVHNMSDCNKVIEAFDALSAKDKSHIVVGINNRDLGSLAIDLRTTPRLAKYLDEKLPDLRGRISESGIESPRDTQRLSEHVDGFLIGTSILRAKDPAKYLSSLRPIKVKFCGFTNKNDINAAEKLGADFIGLIFVKESPRYVSLSRAKQLKKHVKHAKIVGVFGDMPTKEIERYRKELDLDFIQLHGQPDLQRVKKFSDKAIQVFQGNPSINEITKFSQYSKYILIDKEPGKKYADFSKLKDLPSDIRAKVFIAGGICPENVRHKAIPVRPYAVDCASGIEYKNKPGQKSSRNMRIFMNNLAK